MDIRDLIESSKRLVENPPRIIEASSTEIATAEPVVPRIIFSGEEIKNWTPQQRFENDVLTYLDVYYNENGRYPTASLLHKQFENESLCPPVGNLEAWSPILDAIADKLEDRGLPVYDTTSDMLDWQFIALCNVMVDPGDKRTPQAKLKEFGKTHRWWVSQLKRRANLEYYTKRVDQIFDEQTRIRAKQVVSEQVNSGDLSAVKYYNEWTGQFNPADRQMQNFGMILQLLLEILAKHVETEVMQKVADELDSFGINQLAS